jgi:hypothetical protein
MAQTVLHYGSGAVMTTIVAPMMRYGAGCNIVITIQSIAVWWMSRKNGAGAVAAGILANGMFR